MSFKKAYCLGVEATAANARKLAQDLVSLQSRIYHMTKPENLLDQNPDPGHTNYELNKFGVALAQAIKIDLREHPSKKVVKFYVALLDACWELKNYELGARVYQGMNDAITRDEVILEKGVYEIPEEDPKDKAAREEIKDILKTIKKWNELVDKRFPTPAASKKLYEDHLRDECMFVPSVQAVMNFIAIRLDNVKSILIDGNYSQQDKYTRLSEIKKEILAELEFIETIIRSGLPVPQDLNFQVLMDKFEKEVSLKLRPVSKNSDQLLDEMLKLDQLLKPKKVSVEKGGGFSAKLFPAKETPVRRKKAVHVKAVYLKDIQAAEQKSDEEVSPRTNEPDKPGTPSPGSGRKG